MSPILHSFATAIGAARLRRTADRFGSAVDVGVGAALTPGSLDDPLDHPGTVHLVGAGGSGMRSLAVVLAAAGWRVSGSDAADPLADHSQSAYVAWHGHDAAHVPLDACALVYSSAIPDDNCERLAARRLGIPELSYPQMLGRLQSSRSGRIGVAVAGTHGKSTTCAMLTSILAAAGADPTAVFGAAPLGEACGGRFGAGSHVVVEACEYQRNFLQLAPQAAVVLNLEWDHCETYPQLVDVQRAFAQFARRLPRDGLLLVHHDCSAARRACLGARANLITFGESPAATWRAIELEGRQGQYRFRLAYRDVPFVDVALQVPGRHNVQNALAAAALAFELGMPAAAIRRGLSEFPGIERRCQTVGTFAGVTLVDDYAHHPTELRATLATVAEQYPGRRVWCVFQPHQAARTAALLDELALSLHNADAVLVADIYRARESGDAPVTSDDLARRVPPGPRVCEAIHGHGPLVDRLAAECQPGDVVVTCGAGDIGKVLDGLRERL